MKPLRTQQLMQEKGLTYVHPYDDPDVIAGQGTVGMKYTSLQTHCTVFVPVGGGGGIAGVAAYIKYVRPDVKVFAVEAEESACLAEVATDYGAQVGLLLMAPPWRKSAKKRFAF